MQDKRFFQLVFTPFVSSAMSGDIDPKANMEIMLDRMVEMPDKLRSELVAGLEAELKVSQLKSRSLPSNIKSMYLKKIDAIETLLMLLPERLARSRK